MGRAHIFEFRFEIEGLKGKRVKRKKPDYVIVRNLVLGASGGVTEER
jgi:hypothetical protein